MRHELRRLMRSTGFYGVNSKRNLYSKEAARIIALTLLDELEVGE